jgi:hypothetical protein
MSKPVYTVQVDSRFRDLEKYPNTTDFGVSFKKRTSTTPFVEGLPVNTDALCVPPRNNTSFTGSNFYVPVSIDPDFDNDLFQIVNGKITNMKAIDANNVVLTGIFTGETLSFYQNDAGNIFNQFSPSNLIISLPNNNFSVFLVKFSRIENTWTFNWAILAKQPDDYIALNDPNINCSFDIDDNNSNICFMFNFSSPKIYIQSLTSLSVQNNNEYITLYEVYHPDNTTKTDNYPYNLMNCLFYSLFDFNGNVKYVDNHPWGYNIISSCHNIIPSESNCKFNIKFDNSLAQIVSANTNNYEPVLSLTGYGVGNISGIFPNENAYGITYDYSGTNYVVNIIPDPITNQTNILTQEYKEGKLYQTNKQCLTGLTSNQIVYFLPPNDVFLDNQFVNVSYLEKNNNIYFHFSPYNAFFSNPTGVIPPSPFFIPSYQSYIYSYDKITQNMQYITTGAGDFNGSRLGFPGGQMFDSTSIDPSNLTGAYIIGSNTSVYGTTGSTMDIYYWDETTNPPYKINSYDFSPARKTIISLTGYFYYDYFGIGYYSTIIQDNQDVYYVCSPAPLATGTMTGDGLLFDNITSIYKINSISITGTQISNTIYSQSYFYPKLYLQNSQLNLISAAPNSQILNIDKTSLEYIQKSKFIGGGFSVFLKEYNNNLYAIYNSQFFNKVFNINEPENPVLISGKQEFPVFNEYETGKLLFIDDEGWSYGFLLNKNLNLSYFFGCPFITKPAHIISSHYNENITSILNPVDNYGNVVSTYSLDYLYVPPESNTTNSFGFNPLEQLVDLSGNSILYAWYDASNTGSIMLSGTGVINKIEEVIDLSNNNRNLLPYTGSGIGIKNDIIYKYGNSIVYQGGMDLRSSVSSSGAVYMAIAFKNNSVSTREWNISGFYDNGTDAQKYEIYSYYNGNYTYLLNFAGSNGIQSTFFSSAYPNQPIRNLCDFQYYNTGINGIYDSSFRGSPSFVLYNTISINFSNSYFKLGDSYNDLIDTFKGEIYEVIITSSLPTTSQRQKIMSYLGKKWNMNTYVPDNNPYKQYSDERLYSTLLTKGSTGYASVDLYNISNIQNIAKIESIDTTITDPSYMKTFSSNNNDWIFVLGKSSLEIYTNLFTKTEFLLFNKISYDSVYSSQCWKVLVYEKLETIYVLVLFKNGYVKKYKLTYIFEYNVQELLTEKFELPSNGFLTSGEIYQYNNGKIYFFGMVGITDVNLSDLSLQIYRGSLYFCDITNEYDFIKIESSYNYTLKNVALTNRNSTKVINHPNGNIYLYLRSIFLDAAQFINITDYNLFNHTNYGKIQISNNNSFSYQTPINISDTISYEDGNFGCFCPADIYVNPSNKNLYLIETQNTNLLNDYLTPQDQQFYLGFTNCNYITNDPEGVMPIYPFGTRVTQLKAGIIANKVYAGMLLTDISNSFAATGVYFVDISNPSFTYTYFQNSNGDYPEPITSMYENLEGISIGFVDKCDYQGFNEWLVYLGGSYTGLFSQYTNISNMTLDADKRYIYLCGGWNSKVECFDKNNQTVNSLQYPNTSYNGFCTKIDIIDGNFQWINPILGNNNDFTEKIAFNKTKNDVSFLINFSSNNLFLYEPQYSSTGYGFYNPKVVETVLFNTSSLTSSIITLDTDGHYKWKTILYTNDPEKSIETKDIYIDDETINIVGTNNCSIMRCTQSDNTDVQLLYNTTTNSSLYIYRFDLDGKYIQSDLIKYPNNVNLYVNDIKAYKNINEILVFPYVEILDSTIPFQIISKYNKDGSIAKINTVSTDIFLKYNPNIYLNTGSTWFTNPNINNNAVSNGEIQYVQFYKNQTFIARQNNILNFSAGGYNSIRGTLEEFNGITNIPCIFFQDDKDLLRFKVNVMKNIGDDLYIGGDFLNANLDTVNNIIYLTTGTFSSSEDFNTVSNSLGNNGLNGPVFDVEGFNNDVYIGGNFTGDIDNLIYSPNIIKYNTGSGLLSGLSTGLNGIVRALATDGTKLYAGGDFTGSNSTLLNYVGYWDGTGWFPLSSGLNGRVNSLYYKNSNLYAGGEFTKTSDGSIELNYIARWDGSSWNPMYYGLSNTVNVITNYTGNFISVGGDFTNAYTGTVLNHVAIWNTTGWTSISTGVYANVKTMSYTGNSELYVPLTSVGLQNNKYTQVNFYKYISSYVDLNDKEYSYLSITYNDYLNYYQSSTSPSGENSLTNYNAFIQGSKFPQSKISETKQTIVAPNTILNKNYSIRGNFFTGTSNFFSGSEETTFKIILNQVIDIKSIDRVNLPFPKGKINSESDAENPLNEKWSALITKSPVGDSLIYEPTGPIQYISNGILPITITNIYGQSLSLYSDPTKTTTPYYVYFYSYTSTGNIEYIPVNSVIYNSSQKIYYLTLQIDNYNELSYFFPYEGYINVPNLFLSKKNLSAEYTLQFYPATLNSSKVFNLSLNNLIIPNRPIRNTTLEGTRLLTDLPYIYLSVFNADDNGFYYGQTGASFGRQEINNFFSNNVTRDANAIFEIPMKYAIEQENFVVLSSATRPRIKFTPNYYNIRYIITDPDGNVLLFDNTPYKSIDNFAVVPDSLLQTNVSLNFEPLTN